MPFNPYTGRDEDIGDTMLHRPTERQSVQFRSTPVMVQQHRTSPPAEFSVPFRPPQDPTFPSFQQRTGPAVTSRPGVSSGRCPPLDLEFLWRLHQKRRVLSQQNNNVDGAFSEHVDIMRNQGFPTGLAKRIIQYADQHPLRIYLVDNSSTMYHTDGHVVVQSKNPPFGIQLVDCTRWEEICAMLIWHAEFAAWCQTPMVLRLLHDPGATVGPQQVGVAASTHLSCTEEVDRLKDMVGRTRPLGGTTPLLMHLREFLETILEISPRWQQEAKGMVLVICTDGLPTDDQGQESPQVTKEFTNTLQLLQGQDVSVVIRLSTDEERVVQFYQQLDHQSESSRRSTFQLDVLDDFVSECRHVQRHNPWLNYGYPLHLCREQGISDEILDALHKRTLSIEEASVVMGMLFDIPVVGDGRLEQPNTTNNNLTSIGSSVPTPRFFKDPQMDYVGFREQIKDLNDEHGVFWNPIPRKFLPWINVKKLDKLYDPHRNYHPQPGGDGESTTGCSCVMS